MRFPHPVFDALLHDDAGQDMIEYALVAALVGLGAIVSLRSVATGVRNAFTSISTAVTSAV